MTVSTPEPRLRAVLLPHLAWEGVLLLTVLAVVVVAALRVPPQR